MKNYKFNTNLSKSILFLAIVLGFIAVVILIYTMDYGAGISTGYLFGLCMLNFAFMLSIISKLIQRGLL